MSAFTAALGILVGLATAGTVVAIVFIFREPVAMSRMPDEPKDPHPERHAAAVALAHRSPWMIEHAREIVDAWYDAWYDHCAGGDFDRWCDLVMQVGLESAVELAASVADSGIIGAWTGANMYGGAGVQMIATDETSEP